MAKHVKTDEREIIHDLLEGLVKYRFLMLASVLVVIVAIVALYF